MAYQSYKISSERLNYAVGLIVGSGLKDNTKIREKLKGLGYSDREISIVLVEQAVVVDAIEANEQPTRPGRKAKVQSEVTPDDTDEDDEDYESGEFGE